jgi:PTS system glucose-specific IIA component
MGLFTKLIAADTAIDFRKKWPLVSPLTGKVHTLDKVPCPLFGQRLFGEGVAIEPAGYQLLAPCSGQLTALDERGHQLRLQARNGLIIMIQLGIGSEHMLGEGFKRLIKPGQKFSQGQVLLEFDLIKMKKQLVSTLCPVTIVNSDKLLGIEAHCHHVMAGEDPAMTLYI